FCDHGLPGSPVLGSGPAACAAAALPPGASTHAARGGARALPAVPSGDHRRVLRELDLCFFFFQAEDGIRDFHVTGVQTCALPILLDIADLDGDIDMDVEADRAAVSIISEEGGRDLQKLVGRDGEVLEALQELTRLDRKSVV